MIRSLYHLFWAFFSALIYRFPSREIFVVGVTGTKGKTTVTELISFVLEAAGFRTAVFNSHRIKIGETAVLNKTGNTMPGRGRIQKFLRQAAENGCRYAVIEVTSQGVLQNRHRFVNFSAAVFTNLTPEHLEAHGGFENYRAAKLEFFRYAAGGTAGIFLINKSDAGAALFAEVAGVGKAIFYSKSDLPAGFSEKSAGFGLENFAAARAFARSQNIGEETIKKALLDFPGVPGRMEYVQREPFAAVVDYAHTPDSLEAVYRFLSGGEAPSGKLVCVLGAAGGGRDRWKRPKMGEIAARWCREIILTDEDPYDEPPLDIISQIESGVAETRRAAVHKIPDRKEAVEKAVSLARAGDTVIITGKGSEPWIHLVHGRKIPWSDRDVIETALKNKRGAL